MLLRHLSGPLLVLGALLGGAGPVPVPAPAAEQAPAWFREHMRFMTRGSGRFVADNAAYRSADEPFDAYGTEWSYGLGEQSLVGRLFGLLEEQERGTFWEFRVYWDPAAGQVRMLQFGLDGTVGDGWLAPRGGPGELAAEQTFTGPDGSAREVRHESSDAGERHTTASLSRIAGAGVEGEWQADREYVWVRQPADE